tara:strand:+ start:89 stop:1126 length:1038 start_codon:yes stop_codon:yes gene_type:complete
MAGDKAYAAAGVDIDAANRTKSHIGEMVRSTFGPEVLTNIGGFGGLFAPNWKDYEDPVLVASADGVGTKLRLAFLTGIHHTVGADLVAHCANDILVQGARPLFFLDYLAMPKHEPEVAKAIVRGVANGCKNCGCALLGGEMAEMPGFYQDGEYDLAGTIVGIVDRDRILDGNAAQAGDALIGLGSSGLHTNGYSLARKLIFETAGWNVHKIVEELGGTVGEALLAPHRSYVNPVFALMEEFEIKGIAHITGGGLLDNVPRSLPEGLGARLSRGSWPENPIFALLQELGSIETSEMFQAFNMGLGLVLVVSSESANIAVEFLHKQGEQAYIVGQVEKNPQKRIEIA